MAIISRSYNTVPGAYRVFDSSLYGVTILGVEREGTGYTSVASLTPVNREFHYQVASIYFDSAIPFVLGEKVWVLYQT